MLTGNLLLAHRHCANVDWLVAGIITIEVEAGVNFHYQACPQSSAV